MLRKPKKIRRYITLLYVCQSELTTTLMKGENIGGELNESAAKPTKGRGYKLYVVCGLRIKTFIDFSTK